MAFFGNAARNVAATFLAGRRPFGLGGTFDYNPITPGGPPGQGSGGTGGSGGDDRGVGDPWRPPPGTFFPPVRSPRFGLGFFGSRKAIGNFDGFGPGYFDFNPLGAQPALRSRVAPPPPSVSPTAPGYEAPAPRFPLPMPGQFSPRRAASGPFKR